MRVCSNVHGKASRSMKQSIGTIKADFAWVKGAAVLHKEFKNKDPKVRVGILAGVIESLVKEHADACAEILKETQLIT